MVTFRRNRIVSLFIGLLLGVVVYSQPILTGVIASSMFIGETYYVSNTGDDSDDGLTPGTAWETIAEVNAASFNPGDRILFNKGDVWRETLTVPSSGNTNRQITFSAYGTGADPIIDGSDIASIWVEDEGETWSTTTELSISNYDIGATQPNARMVLETTDQSTSGTKVRISIQGHSTTSAVIRGVSICERDGTSEDGVATPIRVTFGGLDAVTIGAGETALSDEITYSFDKDNEHLIHVYIGDGGTARTGSASTSGGRYYTISDNTDQTVIQAPDMDGLSSTWLHVSKVEVMNVGAGVANVYNSTIAAETNIVFRDGVPAAKGATKATLNDHEWVVTGNILSYRDDSGTPQGAGYVITAAVRDDAITIANNYITIDGLDLRNTNADGISGGSSKYNIYRNNNFEYIVDKGVYLNSYSGSPVTSNIIEDNTFNHIQGYGINLYGKSDIVRNNIISNMGDYYADVTVAHQYTAGIDIEPTQTQPTPINTQVYGNVIDELDGDGSGQSSHGIYIQYQTTGLDIHDNVISNIRGGDGIKMAGSGNVYNNIIYNCHYAAVGTHSYTDAAVINVYYNIFYNNGYGIQQNDQIGTLTLAIYNNTFYKNGISSPSSDNSEIYIRDNLTSLIVKNNIVYASDGELCFFYREEATSDELDYNLCYREDAGNFNVFEGSSQTWVQWQTLGYDTNGDNDDPDLTNPTTDFSLQVGSPAINAGVDVGLTSDFYGNPIVGVPDIGAIEKQ